MIPTIFTIVFLIYCFLGALAYMPSIKNSSYYYYLGIGLAIITNLLWLYLSKITTDERLINKYSYIWDGIIFLTASLIPIIFFGIIPKGNHLIGIILIIIGMIMIKL